MSLTLMVVAMLLLLVIPGGRSALVFTAVLDCRKACWTLGSGLESQGQLLSC